jgi:hypothetical protein
MTLHARPFAIFLFALAILCRNPLPAQDVAKSKASSLSLLRAIYDQIEAIKIKSYDPEIPVPLRPLLTSFKHSLRDVVTETITDDSGMWQSPAELRMLLLHKIRQAGMMLFNERHPKLEHEQSDDTIQYSYNEIKDIAVETPPGHNDLLAVTTSFWVMCGEDTSLYLYKRVSDGWRLVLAHEANDYSDVSGAQGDYRYSVSPCDREGKYFVVSANVNPWCTSNWQALRFVVFRPSSLPYSPKILLQGSETIYIGVDPPLYKLSTTSDSFTLSFRGDWREEQGASQQCLVYKVRKNRARLWAKRVMRNQKPCA